MVSGVIVQKQRPEVHAGARSDKGKRTEAASRSLHDPKNPKLLE